MNKYINDNFIKHWFQAGVVQNNLSFLWKFNKVVQGYMQHDNGPYGHEAYHC